MFKILKDMQIELETGHILKGQGIDPAKASPRVAKIAAAALDEANSLLRPAALYGTMPVLSFDGDRVAFDGGSFSGPLVARAFAGASSLTLALYTIGPALEQRMDELMGTDMLRAMALDGAGTAALSLVSRLVEARITREVEQGDCRAGMRASPGQEGWPIEQQRILFRIIPAEEIGVELTGSCLMLPRKSVSFVMGSGEGICADHVSCDLCSKRGRCRWRKEAQSS
ncbi:MAG TPA: hypothetical protein GX744_04270 [Firmicutes bacterium]|jgi:hypothetical protein|nr:hypothetical protein [Bacillota bacterium]